MEEEEPGKVNKAASFWAREVDFTVFAKGRPLVTLSSPAPGMT